MAVLALGLVKCAGGKIEGLVGIVLLVGEVYLEG